MHWAVFALLIKVGTAQSGFKQKHNLRLVYLT